MLLPDILKFQVIVVIILQKFWEQANCWFTVIAIVDIYTATYLFFLKIISKLQLQWEAMKKYNLR